MGNFFGNLNDKVQTFMMGRNGPDRLARWALGGSVLTLFVNVLFPNVVCSVLSYALLFYCVYRMFSSNVPARRQENEKFEEFLGKFSRKGGQGGSGGRGPASGSGSAKGPSNAGSGSAASGASASGASAGKADPAKMSFPCEQCGQSLSVPKGRGTLKVTCPKCHHQQKVKS